MRGLLTLAVFAAALPAQAPRPVYAITNAKIVVAPGRVIDAGTVVLRNGLIESAGANAAIPADARIFDAKGLTVYPGLIDAATFYGFPAPARSPSAPGGPAPSAAPAPAQSAEVNSPLRYLRPEPSGLHADVSAAARLAVPNEPDPRRNQGFTTVLAIPRDGQVHGTSALVNLGSDRAAQEIVLSPVAMHVSFETRGAFLRGYPTSLMGVYAILRQSLLRARQYRDALKLYADAGRRGMARPAVEPAVAALLPVLDGTVPVVFSVDRAEDIRRVLRFSDEFRLRPVILGGAEAWRVASELKRRDVPVLVRLSLLPPPPERGFEGPAQLFEFAANSPERIAAESNPGKLEKAGVRFAFATGGWEHADQIRAQLRTAVSRGLSADTALRALTASAADILGAREQLGTIEPGKIANLALVEGDLLGERARVRSVFIDGMPFYPGPERPAPGARATSIAEAAPPVQAPGPPAPRAHGAQAGEPGGDPQDLPRRSEAAAPGQAPPSPAPRMQGTQPGQGATNPQDFPRVAGAPDDPTPATPARTARERSASPIPERRPPLPEPAPADLVIRNATVLTVTRGTIENGAVWIHEGKIREVGRSVNAPPGAKVIDGTGRFVMPGIIDSHSHAAISGGVNEGGPAVTAQCRIADVLNPDDINLYRQSAAGVTTLNVLHGSANPIGGENATVKVKWGSPVEGLLFPGAPRGIKMALGENPKRSNFSPGARFPATRMGVEQVIRESFKAAREYMRAQDEYKARFARGEKVAPPENNLGLETLAGVLRGEVLVHAHCYRADEISMLLDLADEFGFKIRSLQHVLEGYKVVDKIRRHGAGASTFADFWGYKMEAFDGTAYNAAMLVRGGVRTAINSDSDERARRLYADAAKTMKYGGLTENEALRLITADAAWMLGVEKRVGALEPGMDGDLAVFNAHPFSPYARVEMTVVDGQIVFDRQRDIEHRLPWKREFQPETDPIVDPTDAGEEAR